MRNENRFCIFNLANDTRKIKRIPYTGCCQKSLWSQVTRKYLDPDETLVFVYEILHNSHDGQTCEFAEQAKQHQPERCHKST